jgi:quinol-cytochrome oxidoreductase complex cytochrome b subunit
VSAGQLPPGVSSWLYVFGLAALAALIVIVGSGAIIALKGPDWWHYAAVGRFFNSLHLWAVELFFLFTVVHLWGKYWIAAWRGGRARVWTTGAIALLAAVPAALTGYLSQQNFDAQWIAVQAKDAINATGAGAFFSATDFGQMYSYHVLLLPAAMIAIVAVHVLLVRRHGLVPPFERRQPAAAGAGRSRAGAAG